MKYQMIYLATSQFHQDLLHQAESRSDPSEATGSWSAAFPDQRNSPPRLSVWISSWFKMHRIKKWATKKGKENDTK